jgi:hypothetical protein
VQTEGADDAGELGRSAELCLIIMVWPQGDLFAAEVRCRSTRTVAGIGWAETWPPSSEAKEVTHER